MKIQTHQVPILFVCATSISIFSHQAAAESVGRTVERSGIHAELRQEQVVTGNLDELNGKYKLRVAAVTYDIGGFIGNHHHAGPGLRCVTSGTLTYVQEGETFNFGPGDCFYESGNADHHANNNGDEPVKLFNFQILPIAWEGSSAITVTAVPE
jgi:quercetin dioxygenase-like cupin family protein